MLRRKKKLKKGKISGNEASVEKRGQQIPFFCHPQSYEKVVFLSLGTKGIAEKI